MKRLSKRQEEVLAILWEHGPLPVSKIVPLIDKNLHFNTISTVIRGLEKSGLIKHIYNIKPYSYYAIIKKEPYINYIIREIIKTYFKDKKNVFIKYIENQVI